MIKKGGPPREAFDKENVEPVSFTKDDPFWDLSPMLNLIEKEVRANEVDTLIILKRTKKGIMSYWRGTESLTTALGILSYSQLNMYAENVLIKEE